MVIWLQRHEAMWLWESYLIWVEKRLPSIIRMDKDQMMDEEEDVDVDPNNVTKHYINITDSVTTMMSMDSS